jgi:hypothetical protein
MDDNEKEELVRLGRQTEREEIIRILHIEFEKHKTTDVGDYIKSLWARLGNRAAFSGR